MTPQVITDDQQTIVWQANYDPFGKANITTELIENNIRFPGQYYDSETDLHYNYFRYYDPSIGRYITSDPIGLAGGLNTYAYVGGNPLKYSDPKGLFFWDVLDLGFFAQSLYEYSQCSSSDNAINLGLDAIGLLPGIPALGTLRRVDSAVDVVKRRNNIIGRSNDLVNPKLVRSGETLLDVQVVRNTSGTINSKATWKSNSSVLRKALSKGKPIRDVSPNNLNGTFLNAERSLLKSRDWKIQPINNEMWWIPPNGG